MAVQNNSRLYTPVNGSNAPVCVQNGFLNFEDEEDIVSLRVVTRDKKKAKTIDCSSLGAVALFSEPHLCGRSCMSLEKNIEREEKSEATATADRLFTVLKSGKLLGDPSAAGEPGHIPDLVYLKTFHNTFLTAMPTGTIECDRPHTLEWEMFKVIDHLDGTISFSNWFGAFLAADPDGGVICTRRAIGNEEKWTWEQLDNGRYVFMSCYKKYLSAKACGKVEADFHDEAGWESPWLGWESFEIVHHSEALRSFQIEHGFELTALHHGWLLPRVADAVSNKIKRRSCNSMCSTDESPSGCSELSGFTSGTDETSEGPCESTASFSSDGESSEVDEEMPPTTMMIRNIPKKYTQKDFCKEFEGLGFKGTFDFLYLPIFKNTGCNTGYCFVNFISDRWAAKCAEMLENYTFTKKGPSGETKIASVSVARVQGLEANVTQSEKYKVAGGSPRSHGPMIVLKLSNSCLAPISPCFRQKAATSWADIRDDECP